MEPQMPPASEGSSPTHTCACCGGGSFRLRHTWPVGDHWNLCSIPLSIWDCQTCGLTSLWPVPLPEQYPDGGDWFSPKRQNLSRKYAFKYAKRRLINRIFGSNPERFMAMCVRAKPSGRFLDVGCGNGHYLAMASKHYQECVGVEPSPIGAAEAEARGFRVFRDVIETAPVESGYYDAVLMDSVIEHVRNPVETLRICHRVLAPGGIVALQTPKLGGPASRIHGRGWYGFRHGYHTFLYTGKTLGACLDKAGFDVLARPKRDRMADDILVLIGRKRD